MSAIQIQNFSKIYEKKEAVIHLSLQVDEGEIFGFIGPNGAGKSTTIKALLDFIKPSEGQLTLFGLDAQKQAKEIRKFTTYVSSEVNFYPNFTTRELLNAVASFHSLKQPEVEIKRLIELFEIDENKKVSELSLGNRKKIALSCSLLPNPRLLILDEPTNGLDPLIQHRLFTELKSRNKEGMTVFLSSHNLTEIQENAHRAAFIREGKLLTIQTISKEKSLGKLVKITSQQLTLADFPKDFKILSQTQENWQALYTGEKKALLDFLKQEKVLDFQVLIPSLEDQFMVLYEGGQLDDRRKN